MSQLSLNHLNEHPCPDEEIIFFYSLRVFFISIYSIQISLRANGSKRVISLSGGMTYDFAFSTPWNAKRGAILFELPPLLPKNVPFMKRASIRKYDINESENKWSGQRSSIWFFSSYTHKAKDDARPRYG